MAGAQGNKKKVSTSKPVTKRTKSAANTKKNTRDTAARKAEMNTKAASEKKTTQKKAPSAKAAPKKKRALSESEYMVRTEVILLFLIGASLILILSNFGVCGKAGAALSYFMFGLFGIFGYIFPIFLVIGGTFYLSNVGSQKAMIKLFSAVILLILLCAIVQMARLEAGTTITDYYDLCGKEKAGGGMLGAAVAVLLQSILGTVGGYIVLLVLAIITFVIITEKSILRPVKNTGKKAYESAKEEAKRYQEHKEQLRKERLRLQNSRTNRKVRGVQLQYTGLEMDSLGKQEKPETESEVSGISDDIFRGHVESKEEIEPTFEFAIHDGTQEPDLKPEVMAEEIPYTPKAFTGNAASFTQPAFAAKPEEPQLDEEGFFKPKERIDVRPSAREAMGRKPFATGVSKSGEPQLKETEKYAEQVAVHTQGDSGDRREIPVPEAKEGIVKQTLVENRPKTVPVKYVMPPLNLLVKGNKNRNSKANQMELRETAIKLQKTLKNFGVGVTITDVSRGPSVTRYELQPEQGTKVSKITALTDDIKLNLAAADIRIEAPIPGKAAVGIEVPNPSRDTVYFRELIESEELQNHPSKLAFAAGKDIAGKVVVADIAKMPHMLIAGTTGSGKSVFTNSIIMSILYRAKPSEVKMIIVDPKVVEFGVYNGIPHLLIPVVTDPRKAAGALNWAVAEMQERYKKFAQMNVRDLKGYNNRVEEMGEKEGLEKMPQIVIIIDELADLMMAAAKEVEEAICRLAQLARAAGIHLIIATQRPSVDVVTGLIKANIPSRVALLVSSGTDSRTIIDMNGAEKLLGNGDMLFYPSGYVKPVRLQGAFISDTEVTNVVNFIRGHCQEVEYDASITSKVAENTTTMSQTDEEDARDMYFIDAAKFVIEKQKASTSMLQRVFRIGYNRAARIMDQLSADRVIGPEEGTKPRKVLMTMAQLDKFIEDNQL